MRKNLTLVIFVLISINIHAQILGNLASIYPNTAAQGQTLTTTITQMAGSYLLGSPPCDNYGIYLMQGANTIYSNFFNWQGMDIVDAEFSIPAATPLGYYDVYVASTHYDWWSGTCTPLGYWFLSGGFEVTTNTNINQNYTGEPLPVLYPDPVSNKSVLSFSNKSGKKYTLSIMDSFGRKVYGEVVQSQRVILSRKDFDAGIYFYRLEGMENKSSFSGRFVVIE